MEEQRKVRGHGRAPRSGREDCNSPVPVQAPLQPMKTEFVVGDRSKPGRRRRSALAIARLRAEEARRAGGCTTVPSPAPLNVDRDRDEVRERGGDRRRAVDGDRAVWAAGPRTARPAYEVRAVARDGGERDESAVREVGLTGRAAVDAGRCETVPPPLPVLTTVRASDPRVKVADSARRTDRKGAGRGGAGAGTAPAAEGRALGRRRGQRDRDAGGEARIADGCRTRLPIGALVICRCPCRGVATVSLAGSSVKLAATVRATLAVTVQVMAMATHPPPLQPPNPEPGAGPSVSVTFARFTKL